MGGDNDAMSYWQSSRLIDFSIIPIMRGDMLRFFILVNHANDATPPCLIIMQQMLLTNNYQHAVSTISSNKTASGMASETSNSSSGDGSH